VLDPLPAVSARIEPLGPALARAIPADPTWEGFVQSFCPVRELAPGERPRDWIASENDRGTGSRETFETGALDASEAPRTALPLAAAPASPARVGRPTSELDQPGHSPPEPLTPERYKVQFTASEEYVRLVEEAKALLSHAAPRATLDEIHLRALRAFVALLRKQKYATAESPRRPARADVASGSSGSQSEEVTAAPPIRPGREDAGVPRRRGRHIPAAVRRAVFDRDGEQCTYIDHVGRRCAERHRLEFHHLTPFALGGEHTAANLALRCAAHNALAAEEDFGRERIDAQREAAGPREVERGLALPASGDALAWDDGGELLSMDARRSFS
jgi:hypothetical protein